MPQQSAGKQLRIAILGWGSLIWDGLPEFDQFREDWQTDGPALPLEFSRVSTGRRDGALTLVIDPRNGSLCQTSFALSKRRDPDDAIADLKCREGTIVKRVGFYFADGSRTCTPAVPEAIAPWARIKNIGVVIWTGLESNFKAKAGEEFSVYAALRHLQRLSPEGKARAAEYVWRAPNFIQTPLRTALQVAPWFALPAADST